MATGANCSLVSAGRTLEEGLRQVFGEASNVRTLYFGSGDGAADPGYAELQFVIQQLATEAEADPGQILVLAVGLHGLISALEQQVLYQVDKAQQKVPAIEEHASAENIRCEWKDIGRQAAQLYLSSPLLTRLIDAVIAYRGQESPLPSATIVGIALDLADTEEERPKEEIAHPTRM